MKLICRFLPNGMLSFVNEAYCRYFNKRPEELIGCYSFITFFPKEDAKKVKECIDSLGQKNPMQTIEHRSVLSTGEIRWQQWVYRAIFEKIMHDRRRPAAEQPPDAVC